MQDRSDPEPRIIDEDGQPFVGQDNPRQQTFTTFQAAPGFAGGVPTIQIPQRYLGRDGKPSFWKILGWKGIVAAILVIAIVVAVAAVSIVAFAIVAPILLVLGLVGAAAARLRGGKSGSGTVAKRDG